MTPHALVLVLALQGGFFGADPSWLPWDTDTHFETQVAHGVITGVVAAAGAFIADENGAKWSALAMVSYYLIRETLAQRFYRRADLTPEEYDKAMWDSRMDVAYPVVVAAIPWSWRYRRDAWPWWLAGIAATVVIGRATDPGGMYAGMR